jgi:hypothetical protein
MLHSYHLLGMLGITTPIQHTYYAYDLWTGRSQVSTSYSQQLELQGGWKQSPALHLYSEWVPHYILVGHWTYNSWKQTSKLIWPLLTMSNQPTCSLLISNIRIFFPKFMWLHVKLSILHWKILFQHPKKTLFPTHHVLNPSSYPTHTQMINDVKALLSKHVLHLWWKPL